MTMCLFYFLLFIAYILFVLYLFFFFFFQAEDGIRDFHVTGVQTCALPILLVADRLAGLPLRHRFPARRVGQEPRDVEAVFVHDPAGNVGDGDDLRAGLRVQQSRKVPSDVAEPLDDHAAPFERDAEVARVFHHHVHDAATGGLLAPERAAERDRLPGHGRGRVAVPARVLVEDPGHDLRVGGDVGRWNVAVRPEHDGNALREAAGEALQLELGELLGIHGDAALRAAERDVHERGLPRHDGREAQHLVVVRLRVVADAALAGASRAVVLDAVAREHLDPPIIHADRD